jgi:hypothetical protein
MASENDLTDRFEAVRARLRETQTETGREKATQNSRRTQTGLSSARDTETADDTAIENTEAFKILTDASLDPEQKIEKLMALLTFNEEDLEGNVQRLHENRAMVAALLADFTKHNKESIELVRDNPLSHLRTGIKEVFEEYHTLIGERADLKAKLELIDQLIEQRGGPQGLIDAMLAARDKELEKNALEKALNEATRGVETLSADISRLTSEVRALDRELEIESNDVFLIFKTQKKRRLRKGASRGCAIPRPKRKPPSAKRRWSSMTPIRHSKRGPQPIRRLSIPTIGASTSASSKFSTSAMTSSSSASKRCPI